MIVYTTQFKDTFLSVHKRLIYFIFPEMAKYWDEIAGGSRHCLSHGCHSSFLTPENFGQVNYNTIQKLFVCETLKWHIRVCRLILFRGWGWRGKETHIFNVVQNFAH